jgi:hypothetical protein
MTGICTPVSTTCRWPASPSRRWRRDGQPMTTADEMSALAAWDTPALSNALGAFRLRSFDDGYTDGPVHRITGGGTMTGRAVTARMVAREPGDDGIPVARLHQAISEMSGPEVGPVQHPRAAGATPSPALTASPPHGNGSEWRSLRLHPVRRVTE